LNLFGERHGRDGDSQQMGVSRDVEQTTLTLTVWPLEGVKVAYFFSYIFVDISKTIQ